MAPLTPLDLDPQMPRLRILEAVLVTLVNQRCREDFAAVDSALQALVETLSQLCSTLRSSTLVVPGPPPH